MLIGMPPPWPFSRELRRLGHAAALAASVVVLGPGTPAVAEQAVRPRVGLVLSGGAARGAAHVGILRVLEELAIPIDVVVGTSMGAAVGGLWSAGLSADELSEALGGVNWAQAFSDRPPRRFRSYRRKEDERGLRLRAQVGLDWRGIAFPLGLLQGEELTFILRSLLLPLDPVDSFDDLPTPFRAVAADLETGEAVVLGSGDLVKAIRASMSIPGVFAPVELDGRLLVDGGIADNLPIDVARALGAERLIVVDISSDLLRRDQLKSVLDVSGQILTLLTYGNTRQQIASLGPDDLLIKPDLGDLGSASFDKTETIMALGEKAARGVADRLALFAVGEGGVMTAARERRIERVDPTGMTVRQVTVNTETRLSPRVVTSRIATRSGQPLDMSVLQSDLQKVYGLELFESVDFDLERHDDGVDLNIHVLERSWGTDLLGGGLELQDDFRQASSFDLRLRHTASVLNHLGAELRTDLWIGEVQRFGVEFYQPLGRAGGFFVAPRIDTREQPLGELVDGIPVRGIRLTRTGGGLDLGRALGNCCELRLGIDWSRVRGTGAGAPGESSVISLDDGGVRLLFAADTLDDVDFPGAGLLAAFSYRRTLDALAPQISNEILQGQILQAFRLGSTRFGLGLELATDLEEDRPGLAALRLGGFLRLSGYPREEILGRHGGLVRLVAYDQLFGAGLLGVPVYVGASVEAGNAWLERSQAGFEDLRLAGSLFLAVESFLGPVYLGAGLGEGHETQYYFLVGTNPLGRLRGD